MHGVGSRNKLRASHARLYPGEGLLDALGRAVCRAGCLPRKELHEAYEMATRIAAPCAGRRVVDLCAGYGLLAQLLVLVSDVKQAVAVDVRLSPNHQKVHAACVDAFPQLHGRVEFVQVPLQRFALTPDDIVVSSHACGPLTDEILTRAVDVGARVAVLPCCHRFRFRADLQQHPDPAAAIDEARVEVLKQRGYDVDVMHIPVEVSPKNRLLVAAPHV